jgi:hypothetical protein
MRCFHNYASPIEGTARSFVVPLLQQQQQQNKVFKSCGDAKKKASKIPKMPMLKNFSLMMLLLLPLLVPAANLLQHQHKQL